MDCMSAPQGPDPLSTFWSPLCAIGSHGPGGPNAQVCVSVTGASIVPAHPRLLVSLWRENYTHGLVLATGSLAVTLLAPDQLGLLEPLGLVSGREVDKLAGLDVELTPGGDPWFPGGVAMIACEVIGPFDLGDATAFLCAVRERRRLREGSGITWAEARGQMPQSFLDRWARKSQRDQQTAASTMRWRA